MTWNISRSAKVIFIFLAHKLPHIKTDFFLSEIFSDHLTCLPIWLLTRFDNTECPSENLFTESEMSNSKKNELCVEYYSQDWWSHRFQHTEQEKKETLLFFIPLTITTGNNMLATLNIFGSCFRTYIMFYVWSIHSSQNIFYGKFCERASNRSNV